MDTPARGLAERLVLDAERVFEAIDCGPHGTAVVLAVRAPGKETANEDAAAVLRVDAARTVLAVADGVGGHPAGANASGVALRALARAVRAARDGDKGLREAILDGFDRANRDVLALGTGSATTLVAVEIEAGRARSYHVGDSGALHFGGRGRMKAQTIAHSPVGYALEAGLLDEHGAMAHADRHIVSNVIGDPGMHVGMSSQRRVRPRDTLVAASDGLFDNAYTEEIVEALRRGPLEPAVEALGALCAARMGGTADAGAPSKPDDLTLVAFRPARA